MFSTVTEPRFAKGKGGAALTGLLATAMPDGLTDLILRAAHPSLVLKIAIDPERNKNIHVALENYFSSLRVSFPSCKRGQLTVPTS